MIVKLTLTTGLIAIALLSLAVHAEDGKSASDKPKKQKEAAKQQSAKKKGADEGPIRLESVFVGDKEQPAISYFIPWQGIGAPDKLLWNVEEKHDKALETVDRDIMLRSIQLYDQLQLESPGD